MGRKRLPDGRRVTLGARVSEQVAAAVDSVRGGVSRSAWVEAAIRSALAEAGASPGLPVTVVADKRVPRGKALVVSPGAEPVVVAVPPGQDMGGRPSRPAVRRCTHPGTRVIGGYCKTCDVVVGPGGVLPG